MRLPAYSASAKVICFIEKLGDWCPEILPNQEVFFRISLTTAQQISHTYIERNALMRAETMQIFREMRNDVKSKDIKA
ncbi:hypothetical protein DA482_04370 [Pseudomonas fluorescens]